jgi:hypothetical protein
MVLKPMWIAEKLRTAAANAGQGDDKVWRRAARTLYGTFGALLAGLSALLLLVDPYRVVPFSLPLKREIVDANQRWLYPMVVRSGRYDSVVIGTSTVRLLDPADLNAAFGGRFVNLSMNAATAWEQMQVGHLFLREVGPPRTAVIGLEKRIWCYAAADQERVTARGFPQWMYDDDPWNDLFYLFNRKTVEIAGRMIANALGLLRPRIRHDGYAVFVPPDASYDLERARRGIWGSGPRKVTAVAPPVTLSEAEKRALLMPALDWLDGFAAQLSGRSRVIFASMPIHIAAQAAPGSYEAAVHAECTARIAAIARRTGALYVDWAVPSSITTQDDNYWDAVHYRLRFAPIIIRGLASATAENGDPPEGTFRVLAP